jgi:hypothetical protein
MLVPIDTGGTTVRKSSLLRTATATIDAAIALAFAVSAPASPASAAPAKATQDVSFTFERTAVAPTAENLAAQNLFISVGNQTSFTFSEVALFFTRFSNPIVQLNSRFNVPPGGTVVFELPDCDDIDTYAVGIFVNGELVLNTENIQPDRDVCIEQLEFLET